MIEYYGVQNGREEEKKDQKRSCKIIQSTRGFIGHLQASDYF